MGDVFAEHIAGDKSQQFAVGERLAPILSTCQRHADARKQDD
jgi:hypothetical protein